MKLDELKIAIVSFIGDTIDEERIPGIDNSFVEMDQGVIHYAGDGGERYLRITLTEVGEEEYFKPYNP
ncbi:MAG: hypothetical protein ACUZ8N_06850 [Candidatus Scalindua sp.]